eukprot:3195878-Pleurochrysis_carterae.AAC.3
MEPCGSVQFSSLPCILGTRSREARALQLAYISLLVSHDLCLRSSLHHVCLQFVRKKRGAVVEKRVDKTSFTASPQPSVERNIPPSPLPSPEQEPDSELGNPVDASASQSRTADPGYVATNSSGLDKWQGYFSMIDEHSLECQDHESPSSAPLFVPTPAKPTPSRAFVHSHGKGSETHRQVRPQKQWSARTCAWVACCTHAARRAAHTL